MSARQNYVDQIIGMTRPSVPLTRNNSQYLQTWACQHNRQAPVPALQIEAGAAESATSTGRDSAGMPPATVNREIAIELRSTTICNSSFSRRPHRPDHQRNATAQTAEHDFSPTVQMPTPSMHRATDKSEENDPWPNHRTPPAPASNAQTR